MNLFDFAKEDAVFIEKTLDPHKRKDLLWRLERSRTFMFPVLIGLSVLLLVSKIFFGEEIRDTSMIFIIFYSIVCYNTDNRIKMLKLIEKMESEQLIGSIESPDK
ncbi:MAG TPA: hypothetical protein PKH77_13980 [Anaerolineae bacterium]|nr:hypothetical protein [Anaerolineae bacterium]